MLNLLVHTSLPLLLSRALGEPSMRATHIQGQFSSTVGHGIVAVHHTPMRVMPTLSMKPRKLRSEPGVQPCAEVPFGWQSPSQIPGASCGRRSANAAQRSALIQLMARDSVNRQRIASHPLRLGRAEGS